MATEKIWSKTEIAHLKRNGSSQSLDELAERFHTDTETVRAQMDELGITPATSLETDHALELYEEGVRHAHSEEWQKAAKAFEALLAETDSRQLADRARMYLAACNRHLDPPQATDDAYLRSVMEKNDGDLDAALASAESAGDAAKDERLAYLMASLRALRGEEAEALEWLGKAIELQPRHLVHAFHDPDFEALRGNQDFAELLGAAAD